MGSSRAALPRCNPLPPPRSWRSANGRLGDVPPVPPARPEDAPPPSPPCYPRERRRLGLRAALGVPPDRDPPAPAVTSASRGGRQHAGLAASNPPVHKDAPRRPPRAAPRQERTDTNRSSMETTPSID